ncbi:MAG: hypothetical protein HY471_03195 [Candidatus Sungbacteria bacterium]|nr:hypothetical protein [Candidatus Sungbacteria bacterium]
MTNIRLTDLKEKLKSLVGEYKADLFLGISVFLISIGSFGLGRLSAAWQPHPKVQVIPPSDTRFKNSNIETTRVKTPAAAGAVVASQNGTAYHLPDCPGAKQIKPENLITFKDAAAAAAAGYKPAGNCPGLQQ